jgi:hypothetical protein
MDVNVALASLLLIPCSSDRVKKDKEMNMYCIAVPLVVLFLLFGIRIVRPTHRGLVERLGKYHRFAKPGFNWIIPLIDKMYRVNITEGMVDAEPQEIITNDNLNSRVDAQVYFKVKQAEGVKQSSRPTSSRRKARHKLLSSSMRRRISISSATRSCFGSWRWWRNPSLTIPKSSFPRAPS